MKKFVKKRILLFLRQLHSLILAMKIYNKKKLLYHQNEMKLLLSVK